MFIATYNNLPVLYVLLIIAMYQKRLTACKANSKCCKCVFRCKQPSTIIIINVQGKCFKGLEKMVQTGEGRVKENFKAIKRKRPSWMLNFEKKGISHIAKT